MTRGTTRACRRALGMLVLVALLGAACARVRPLSGGPADETPPTLLAASPPDSSLFLPLGPELRLHFDEKVSTISVRRGLRSYPHLRVADVHDDGNSAIVTFVDSLPPDTTWAVVVGRAVQDLPKRDNRLLREVWMLYSTGGAIRSGAVYGRVTVHGKPEPKGAVMYEPIHVDSALVDSLAAARGVRPRYPTAATDDEGLFQLLGIPPGQPFRLVAFVDRNGDQLPNENELRTASPETLQFEVGEARRGVQFNLIDPDTPAVVEGVVLNATGHDARVAVALSAVPDSAEADSATAETHPAAALAQSSDAETVSVGDSATTQPAAPDTAAARADSAAAETGSSSPVTADESATGSPPRPQPTRTPPGAAPPVAARADTVRPMPLPAADRAQSPWGAAYARLEPAGFVKPEWRIVYASKRGDYSIELPAGRHRLLAFVDVSADSAPGMYVGPDSTRLEWEPLWVGGIVDLAPGEKHRPRAIEILSAP